MLYRNRFTISGCCCVKRVPFAFRLKTYAVSSVRYLIADVLAYKFIVIVTSVTAFKDANTKYVLRAARL